MKRNSNSAEKYELGEGRAHGGEEVKAFHMEDRVVSIHLADKALAQHPQLHESADRPLHTQT